MARVVSLGPVAGVGAGAGAFCAVVGAAQASGARAKRSVRYRKTTSRSRRDRPKRAPWEGPRQVMEPNAAAGVRVFLAVPGYFRLTPFRSTTTGGRSCVPLPLDC